MQERIPEKLSKFIHEEAERLGLKPVDISTRPGRSFFLEITLDKDGGITLEECSDFNRRISAWIDEEGMFGGRYMLDVCSPGLDRPLKKDTDYEWAVGRQIEVRLVNPVDSKFDLKGRLTKLNGAESIMMETREGSEICIERENISKASLCEAELATKHRTGRQNEW